MNATTSVPQTTSRRLSLRAALQLDAALSGANAVAYLALANVLDGPLGLDATLLRGIGAFFVLFTVAVLWTSRTQHRVAVTAIVEGNALWAVGSLVAAALQWGSPTDVGTVWIVVQGLTVAGFAALQATARR